MPPAPQRVRAWVAHNYPKPAIDEEWLADCSDWIASELGVDPVNDFDRFVQNVEAQLLQSNLTDSTVPGSGIDPLLVASNPGQRPSRVLRPGRQAPRQRKTTGATPLLVEIKNVTEIAHSAFSLLNTHQTRLDRADLGLAHDENAEQHDDEDEGPVPRFSRGMLRLELSDGLTTFRAVEFRSLPQLELGTTSLGYKMLLRSTPLRNGVAFLEPSNVVLKGYRTEDHDVNREQVFLSSLRKRLGRPDPPPEAPAEAQPRIDPPQPVAQPAPQPAPAARPPSPPTDFDDMYADDDVDPDVLRELDVQMDQSFDMQENRRGAARVPPPAKPLASKEKPGAKQILHVNTTVASSSLKTPSNTTSVKTSPYFTAHSAESRLIPDIGLSPRPAAKPDPEPNFDITWDMDDPDPPKSSVKKTGSTSAKPRPPVKKPPPSPDPYDYLLSEMEVDDSFLEQVGMIEQGALGSGANDKGKGKARDTGTDDRPRVAAKKASSGSAVGTRHLATRSASPSRAEPRTRVQSSTKRGISASSLSGSTESAMPQSTQSSDRRLPRDPSLIVISSSDDETPRHHGSTKPLDLARRRADKGRRVDPGTVDSDVIDISD